MKDLLSVKYYRNQFLKVSPRNTKMKLKLIYKISLDHFAEWIKDYSTTEIDINNFCKKSNVIVWVKINSKI